MSAVKQTLPSYEYCVNMAAQYIMYAQVHGHSETFDPERADNDLVHATLWSRKARKALDLKRQQA